MDCHDQEVGGAALTIASVNCACDFIWLLVLAKISNCAACSFVVLNLKISLFLIVQSDSNQFIPQHTFPSNFQPCDTATTMRSTSGNRIEDVVALFTILIMMGIVSTRSVTASSHSLRTSFSPQMPTRSNVDDSSNRNLQLPLDLDLTSTINGLLSAVEIQTPDVEQEQNVLGTTLSLALTDISCASLSVQDAQYDHDPMLDDDTTQRMRIDFIGMSFSCTFRWEYSYPSFFGSLSGSGTGVVGLQHPSSLSMGIDYISEDDKLDPPYDVKVSHCSSDLDINIELQDDISAGVSAVIANALASLMDEAIEEELGYAACDEMTKLFENSEDEGFASGIQLFLMMTTPAKPTSSPITREPTLSPSKSPFTLKPTAFPSKSPGVMLATATPTKVENCYVLSMNERDCKATFNCEWTIDNAGNTLCQGRPILAENCYVLSTTEEECASASNCEWVFDDLGNNLCRDTSNIANPAVRSSAERLSLFGGYYLVVLFAPLVV